MELSIQRSIRKHAISCDISGIIGKKDARSWSEQYMSYRLVFMPLFTHFLFGFLTSLSFQNCIEKLMDERFVKIPSGCQQSIESIWKTSDCPSYSIQEDIKNTQVQESTTSLTGEENHVTSMKQEVSPSEGGTNQVQHPENIHFDKTALPISRLLSTSVSPVKVMYPTPVSAMQQTCRPCSGRQRPGSLR